MSDAWVWTSRSFAITVCIFLAESPPPVESIPVPLNPFGAWFTTLSWAVLVGLNGWCFLRVLSGERGLRRRRPRGA